MELLSSADGKYRLQYELKKSLENEQYEESAEIWQKLQKLGEEKPPSE
jgi:protein-arginine kinase activator protein McsA